MACDVEFDRSVDPIEINQVLAELYAAAGDSWTIVRDAAIAAGIVKVCTHCGDDHLYDEYHEPDSV